MMKLYVFVCIAEINILLLLCRCCRGPVGTNTPLYLAMTILHNVGLSIDMSSSVKYVYIELRSLATWTAFARYRPLIDWLIDWRVARINQEKSGRRVAFSARLTCGVKNHKTTINSKTFVIVSFFYQPFIWTISSRFSRRSDFTMLVNLMLFDTKLWPIIPALCCCQTYLLLQTIFCATGQWTCRS